MSIIHIAVRPVSRIDWSCLFAELVRLRTLIPINTARPQRSTMGFTCCAKVDRCMQAQENRARPRRFPSSVTTSLKSRRGCGHSVAGSRSHVCSGHPGHVRLRRLIAAQAVGTTVARRVQQGDIKWVWEPFCWSFWCWSWSARFPPGRTAGDGVTRPAAFLGRCCWWCSSCSCWAGYEVPIRSRPMTVVSEGGMRTEQRIGGCGKGLRGGWGLERSRRFIIHRES